MGNILNNVVNENPGRTLQTRNSHFQYGRICVGQIQSINTRTGIATVLIPFLAEVKKCHIKMDAFYANNFNSSWIRAMPQTNSMVLVFFDHNNHAYIIGSSMIFNDNDQQVDHPINKMYYALTRSKENGDNENLRNNDWRVLKEGEIDGRSSGGCYYHLSAEGVYSMYSGKTFFKLIRDRNEAKFDADLLRSESSFSTVRFGDVKRKANASESFDSSVVDDSVLNHEFSYRLRGRAPTEAAAPRIFSFRSGNVYNWNNKTITSSSRNSPVRLKIESYRGTDPTTPPTFDLEVDASGNVSLNTDPAGTLLSINTGEVDITSSLDFSINSTGQIQVTTAQSASFTSTTDFSITNGGNFSINSTGPATIKAPTVAIGAAPAGGVVLGPGLASIMNTAAGVFTAQSGIISPLAAAAAGAAAAAAVAPNPGSNAAAITQLAAAVQALAAASAATGTAMTTMATSAASAPVSSATVTATP